MTLSVGNMLGRGQGKSQAQEAKEAASKRTEASAPEPMGSISPFPKMRHEHDVSAGGRSKGGPVDAANAPAYTKETSPGHALSSKDHEQTAAGGPARTGLVPGAGSAAGPEPVADSAAGAAVQEAIGSMGGTAVRETELPIKDLPASIHALVIRTVALYAAPPGSPAARAILDDYYSRWDLP